MAVLLVGLVIWLLPVALTVVITGPQSVFSQLALFFAFAAVITFGGAYALLAYIAQQAVDVYGWLSPDQMLDGLGMAETTPGPLIMVVQFVGFMAAFGQPSGLDPIVAGVVASVLVTWVTFAPSFVWIFTGAPYVESLRNRPTLSAALSGMTAAVVGVIANLGVWFAMQTLFATSGELQHRAAQAAHRRAGVDRSRRARPDGLRARRAAPSEVVAVPDAAASQPRSARRGSWSLATSSPDDRQGRSPARAARPS